jgi:hypothetical protein
VARTPLINAAINYLDRDCLAALRGKPEFCSAAGSNFSLRAVEMQIQDARCFRHELSIDRQGFVLLDHRSAVVDLANMDEARRLYAGEIECLIRDLTGAAAVSVLPDLMLLRAGPGSPRKVRGAGTRPVHFAHSDYSANAARHFARTLFFPDRELDPGRRIAGFNIWRAISPPPQDLPLAVCDVRSIGATDYVLADALIDGANTRAAARGRTQSSYRRETVRALDARETGRAPDCRFESVLLLHNAEHRWAYFSDMTPEEVLIFKSYDSIESHAQRVPHTAFRDSTCPRGVAPRMSIEARAFAYF